MSYAALVRAMTAAGAPPEAIALALDAIEQRDAADEARRAKARDKKRRQRAGDGEGTVTGLSRDTEGTVSTSPPPPDKSPPDPQKLTPTPCVCSAHELVRAAQLSLAVVVAGCQAAIADRSAAAPPAKPMWPKDMPPPPGVSGTQWAGFIAHRRPSGKR